MPHPRWQAGPHSHDHCRRLRAIKHLHSQRTPQKNPASSQGDTRKHNQRRLLCSHPRFCVLRSVGLLPPSSHRVMSHQSRLRDARGSNWDTRKWTFQQWPVWNFAARAPWRHFSLKCEERVHLFVITGKASPQWTHFLSKCNDLLFNGYHLFWQNNCGEHDFPLFLVSLLMALDMASFLSEEQMRCGIGVWLL